MTLPRNRFDGQLHGKTIQDFINQLDYTLTQEQKKQKLFEILNTQQDGEYMDDFFVEYYTKYFKSFLSKKDGLSQSNNISQALERMANYLMFSSDGQRISKKKMESNFYTNARLQQTIRKEIPFSSILPEGLDESGNVDAEDLLGESLEQNYIDELIRNAANYRLDDKQKVTAKDLKDPELQAVVDYHKVINKSKRRLDAMRESDPEGYRTKKWRLGKLMSELKLDEIIAKEGIKKPIRFKAVMHDSTQPDWLCFEECYEDNGVDIIKAELQLSNRDLIFDEGIIKYDLNRVLQQIKLSDIELQIVNLIAFEGLTQEQIGKKLKMSQPAIVCYLNQIAHKVLDEYEEQIEEVAFTHGMKGKYKTCGKCKQTKLTKYFSPDKRNRDGLHVYCKMCRKAPIVDSE